MNQTTIQALIDQLVAFRDARNWAQFHNPKDLAAALSIEAAELQELFLWKDSASVKPTTPAERERLEEELADVAAYLLLLCHELKMDLGEAVARKLVKNEQKYPVAKAYGSALKYDQR